MENSPAEVEVLSIVSWRALFAHLTALAVLPCSGVLLSRENVSSVLSDWARSESAMGFNDFYVKMHGPYSCECLQPE